VPLASAVKQALVDVDCIQLSPEHGNEQVEHHDLSDQRVATKYKWSDPFISGTQILLVQTLGRVVAFSGTREGIVDLDAGRCRLIRATVAWCTVVTKSVLRIRCNCFRPIILARMASNYLSHF